MPGVGVGLLYFFHGHTHPTFCWTARKAIDRKLQPTTMRFLLPGIAPPLHRHPIRGAREGGQPRSSAGHGDAFSRSHRSSPARVRAGTGYERMRMCPNSLWGGRPLGARPMSLPVTPRAPPLPSASVPLRPVYQSGPRLPHTHAHAHTHTHTTPCTNPILLLPRTVCSDSSSARVCPGTRIQDPPAAFTSRAPSRSDRVSLQHEVHARRGLWPPAAAAAAAAAAALWDHHVH